MFFEVKLNNVRAVRQSAGAPIGFEFAFRNTQNSLAQILNYDLQIWLDVSAGSGRVPPKFLGVLQSDFFESARLYPAEFSPGQATTVRFLWHYTPDLLQIIEDVRKGDSLNLQLRGQLLVSWKTQSSSKLAWETPHDPTGTWPYNLAITQSEWVELLNQIEFRHILLHEIRWPAFPASWKRSEKELQEAWSHHKSGQHEEAMLSCRRALECIALNITGDPKASRKAVIAQIFPGVVANKQTAVEQLWQSVQNLLNLAVHNQGQPMHWTFEDGEICLLSTTALLAYLAGV